MPRTLSAKDKVRAAQERYRLRTGRVVTSSKKPPMPDVPCIELGHSNGRPVPLAVETLTRHMHVIGTTSAGKSNFLDHVIRQLISKGYGVCLLDPHGGHSDGLYTKTMAWLSSNKLGNTLAQAGRLHLIDPNTTSHVTGFNPLMRPDDDTSLSVVAGAMLGALERVWGDEDSHTKPTIRRVLKGTFHALAEQGLTLAETSLIFDDPQDRSGIRAALIEQLEDPYAISVLMRAHRLGTENRTTSEYDAETIGPINRIADFLSAPAIRTMVGQTENTLDFPSILDDGHVLLANLQEGSQVGSDETDLLGRMLLHALFFHTKRRRHPERPYFIIVDECHRLLSGDVAHILSESRKFGVGLLLGHQYLEQIRGAGERIHHAVRNNCGTKLVFRIEDTDEATELANTVIPLDLEMPVEKLIKPTAVAQEIIDLKGRGLSKNTMESVTNALTEALAETHGESVGSGGGFVSGEHAGQVMTADLGWLGTTDVLSQSSGISSATSNFETSATMNAVTKSVAKSVAHGLANGTAIFESVTEALQNVYKELPGAVHSKDNVLYMAARTLRTLETGSAFVSHHALAAIVDVPLVPRSAVSRAQLEALKALAFDHSPASLPTATAVDQIKNREKQLADITHAPDPKDDGETQDYWEPMPEDD